MIKETTGRDSAYRTDRAALPYRGMRRQSARGTTRITENTSLRSPGTHTVPRRFRSAATVASAT